MTCAVCHEPVRVDGPIGFVHQDGCKFGSDGHEAFGVAMPEQ